MKKSLFTIFFLLTISISIFAQTPQVKIPITVSDGVTSQVLNFGLDPSATNGIDAALGELELPPLPPSGVFDARFLLPANYQTGSLSDYRLGYDTTNGEKTYRLQYQVGTGSSITISWNLPTGVTGVLMDLFGGVIVNHAISGTGNYIVPNNLSPLNMIITYDLATKPAVPTLSSPANNSTGVSVTPTLTWNSVTDADTYNLQIAIDANFTAIIKDTSQTDTSYQVTTALSNGTKYYWRVSATNTGGTSSWSAEWNFTVIPPQQYSVNLSSNPSNGGTTNGGGAYNVGASVTVTATANSGYTFTNWKEGGNVVSSSSSYSFTMPNNNRTLVANFIVYINDNTALSFSPKTDFTTEIFPQSVFIGDLNGDGKPDLALAYVFSASVSVFLNTTTPGASTPSFSSKTDFTTGSTSYSVSIGDLNGDGKPDLVVANNDSTSVSVFINTTTPGAATPTFSARTDFTTGSGPVSVSVGDMNGDGLPDLAMANINSNSVSVLLNTTTPGTTIPSFSPKTDFTTGNNPWSVSIRDLNGDGLPDLVVANWNSATVSVFLNTTTPGATIPSFSSKTDFATGNNPRSVSIGDLNGDGKPDLAVANQGSNSISVFFNTTTSGASAPSFFARTDFTTGTEPVSVSIGNLDGDSKPDLAVANVNSDTSVSVFLNTTTSGAAVPSFSAKTDFTTGRGPSSVSIDDLNGDGKPDLAVANAFSNSVSVLLNTTNVTGVEDYLSIPNKFALSQNFPNPFNPSTTIRYTIPKQSLVTIKVYNVLGEEIKILVNKELNIGVYEVNFDASNLASGIYFYSLRAGDFVSTKKLILMK